MSALPKLHSAKPCGADPNFRGWLLWVIHFETNWRLIETNRRSCICCTRLHRSWRRRNGQEVCRVFDLADDLPGGVTPAQTVDVTEKAVTADEKERIFRKPPKNPEQASVLSPAPPGGTQSTIAPWHLYPVRVEKIQYSKWVARILLPRAGVADKALGGLGTELLREVCVSSAGALGKMAVWGRCQALLTSRSNRLATSGSVGNRQCIPTCVGGPARLSCAIWQIAEQGR